MNGLLDRHMSAIMAILRHPVQTPADLGQKLQLLHRELEMDQKEGDMRRPGLWKHLREDIARVLLPTATTRKLAA